MLQNAQANATYTDSKTIALLLDQEKAYDRVHPEYLARAMATFKISSSIIHSITHLFFSTQIQVNINGHVSPTVSQGRITIVGPTFQKSI